MLIWIAVAVGAAIAAAAAVLGNRSPKYEHDFSDFVRDEKAQDIFIRREEELLGLKNRALNKEDIALADSERDILARISARPPLSEAEAEEGTELNTAELMKEQVKKELEDLPKVIKKNNLEIRNYLRNGEVKQAEEIIKRNSLYKNYLGYYNNLSNNLSEEIKKIEEEIKIIKYALARGITKAHLKYIKKLHEKLRRNNQYDIVFIRRIAELENKSKKNIGNKYLEYLREQNK